VDFTAFAEHLPMTEEAQSPRLLERVREVMRLKHLSLKTEKSYLYYIRDFILFHNKRHPREMGVAEIRQYLSPDHY
jgi:hypothetical protein